LHVHRRGILYLRWAVKQIPCNDCAFDGFSKQDVTLSLAEFAPPHKQTSRGHLDSGTVSRIAPLHEGAVAKAQSAFASDFGDLITWSPKRAVTDANNSSVGIVNFEHRRIVAVE
jgi:hypothetical protein